ncbi:amino acid adenylation domain-containing protein [Lysobacter brunescens]|uniref:Amino acid adenylation domain-containing protein n=2 Tax=Lysobacter brunescens TaxID=262323 RepID=A0ABW2Y9Q3_9GAMM
MQLIGEDRGAARAAGAAHRAFERHAAERPQALALVHGDVRMDYATLNRLANQLAHRLIALGVGPDDRVALCMPRGPGMAVAVLGVLKAGGAYVPLDPAHPTERLAYMLQDSQPRALLTETRLRDLLPPCDAPVLALDDDPVLATQPVHDPEVATLSADRLAYVIYTSGSTGRPKGVMVPHAGVLHYLAHAVPNYLRDDVRGGLVATSLGFDATVTTLLAPWQAGKTVVLLDENPQRCLEQLQAYCAGSEPWLFKLTPTHLDALSALEGASPSPTRHRVVVGGEQFTRRTLARFRACVLPQAVVVNEYGPTETVVGCTTYTSDGAAQDDLPTIDGMPLDNVPIGRAIEGMQVHLLGADLQPVAPGEIGELFIGGAGVTRGYLGRPELTRERFVPDPFSTASGARMDARMYRSGDLARALPDGTLEYLGRNDFQVKLRGFRIELGEIESVLAEQSGVAEAVVLARPDASGEKQLVAWYRPAGEGVTASALCDALTRVLPAYMVPSAYVAVRDWPQTVNGKLDRDALPAPAAEDYPSEAYLAPEGATETTLAGLWAELLKRERIGRDDRFLRIGGDSLRLIQLASRIRAVFGVSLPIHALFKPMSLAEMARAIEATAASAADAGEAPGVDDSFDRWTRPEAGLPARPPLSYQQYGLWLLEQLTSTSIAYNAQNVVRIRGRFDPVRFGRAIEHLAQRHEILRTTFHAGEDGEPYQQVHPVAEGMFEYLEAASPWDEETTTAFVRSQVLRSFDLAQLPLAKFTLVRLAPEEYLLVQVEQHYVHDGWSINLILRELLAIYDAMGRGEAPPLEPMAVQFGDYATWQRSEAAAARFRRQARYWKDKLAGAALQLPMITDRPRPAVPSYRGGQLRIELPEALASALRAFCQREGFTLYATMQAMFQLTISRYAGCEDFVIGSAVGNRVTQRSEGLVGMFVNMVPVRCTLSGDLTARGLLDRVTADLAEAYDHQEAPFEWVVREVQPERDAGRNPLFQVAFSSHNSVGPRLKWPEFELDIHEAYSNGTSKFDFDVIMIPRTRHDPDGVTMLWSYAADLYDRETIEGICRTYLHLLATCIADPDRRLARFEACDPQARARILALADAARETADAQAGDLLPVHARFEAHAARAPQALAVSCDGESLDYGTLNARANRLAHWLRAQGVAPDARVAICTERSVAAIEAMLAVHKAGGGYLPLDLSYPVDRLAYVLSDARPAVVLADAPGRALLAQALADVDPASRPRIVDLQEDASQWAELSAQDPDRAEIGLRPDHLAYVIYTSGSTGQPKGVMVEHRQLDRLFATEGSWGGFHADDTITASHSFSFDYSVWEIWSALRHGARLVVVPRDVARSADDLHALLCREGVTVAAQTPGGLRTLIEAQAASSERHALRLLPFGGDSFDAAMFAPWFADPRNAGTRLVQLYGITETTVVSTWREMVPTDVHRDGPNSIGVGYDDTPLYVLDPERQLCAFGVAGELYIGGAGVSRGYLGRETLTAERFIDDPFRPGGRLYRSGDLARMHADGSLDYLGRNDFQVKFRGYRIELGEIESRLAALPGVLDAVVLARRDGSDPAQKLVAYYRAADGIEIPADALRGGLQGALPEYMLPSAFVAVAAWPLTANGKLDRAALPAPGADDFDAGAAYVAPRTPVEEAMAEIWARLLGLERVGVQDNFFTLGGHSLLATKLALETREALGMDVSLRDLFEGPTIERLLDVVFSRMASEMAEMA